MKIGLIIAIIYCIWQGWLLHYACREHKNNKLMIAFEIIVTTMMIYLLFVQSSIFPIIVGIRVAISLVVGFVLLILPVPQISTTFSIEDMVHRSWITTGIHSLISLIVWYTYLIYGV